MGRLINVLTETTIEFQSLACLLRSGLINAMVTVESAGNPFAMRSNPPYDRYLKGKPSSFVPPGCSKDTEAIGRVVYSPLLIPHVAVCLYAGQHLPGCYPKFPRYPVWLAKMLSNPVIHMIKGVRPNTT
ncbi:hypothetical protein GTA51_16590 [Desulfovibrio aerotolerans]|uniref:Uncharacterized protein n=1 Tax=Solidesulfovibrio aerotolerans TaxID=295255 RepID=A0A7C9MMM9_9BACT|nr:hypothetical protein [Solidesulfovibrio aerotolerans]MYL84733.1 hypothetical protein [Solidesulfovibrio aerotolerans]